ncbi:MAG: HEAT repeat domain-containing protein [Acidobacteriota bacterium]
MTKPPAQDSGNPDRPPSRGLASRSALLLYIVVALMVLVPYLFWKGTWFGEALTEKEFEEFLSPQAKPRKTQHALTQISELISKGQIDQAKRWYPRIATLADHSTPEVRATVAWVMGQDNTFQPFHSTLLNLLQDSNPLVKQNAALALVRFQDDVGRAELLRMLRPFTVVAAKDGLLMFRLKEGDVVNPGTMLARIQHPQSDEAFEVRSPVPGFFQAYLKENRSPVHQGDPILSVLPSEDQVWEALRALYLVGRPEDLDVIRKQVDRAQYLSARIRQQAELTIKAIQSRSSGTTAVSPG